MISLLPSGDGLNISTVSFFMDSLQFFSSVSIISCVRCLLYHPLPDTGFKMAVKGFDSHIAPIGNQAGNAAVRVFAHGFEIAFSFLPLLLPWGRFFASWWLAHFVVSSPRQPNVVAVFEDTAGHRFAWSISSSIEEMPILMPALSPVII